MYQKNSFNKHKAREVLSLPALTTATMAKWSEITLLAAKHEREWIDSGKLDILRQIPQHRDSVKREKGLFHVQSIRANMGMKQRYRSQVTAEQARVLDAMDKAFVKVVKSVK